jgi:hypothetical protein
MHDGDMRASRNPDAFKSAVKLWETRKFGMGYRIADRRITSLPVCLEMPVNFEKETDRHDDAAIVNSERDPKFLSLFETCQTRTHDLSMRRELFACV